MVKTFLDWMKIKESTAFMRARKQAALGLGPSIPDAEIYSHDTPPKWVGEKIKKRNKDEKGKGHKDDSKMPPK